MAQTAAAAIGVGIIASSGAGLFAAIWLIAIPAVLLFLLWLARRLPSNGDLIARRYRRHVLLIRTADLKVEHRPPI